MSDCDCACHKRRGVLHALPCCDQPPLGREFGTRFHLKWNPSDNPFFDHYEVERSEAGKGWSTIVLVHDPWTTQFGDGESFASTQVSYRVRIVSRDGTAGPWNMIQPDLVTPGA